MLVNNLFLGLIALGLTEAKAIQQQNCTLIPVPNPSHNLHCASYGTFAGTVSMLNNATTASTLTDCAATCRGDSRCISFGFTQSGVSSNCQLFSQSLKHMKMHATGDGQTIYYNDHCWKKACSPIVSTAPSTTTLPTTTPLPPSCSACHSFPKKNGAAPLCGAISALKASSAAPFCNDFLSVGTSTFTETQTTFVPTATVNTSTTVTAYVEKDNYFITSTSTVLLTEIDTYTPTITATATVTSTSTYSCLSTATTLTTSVIMDPALDQDDSSPTPAPREKAVYAVRKFQRFDNGTSPTTTPGSITTASANVSIPAYLSSWDDDTISRACGCLKASSPLTTATATLTLGNGTFTTVQTVTTTPVMNATFTSVVTVFSTAATVTSTIDAVTSTMFTNTLVIPTPSGLSDTGLNFYVYNTSLNYNEQDPGFDATDFNNYGYEYNSWLVDVNSLQTEGYAYGSGETTCDFDTDYDCGTAAVVMQGYFYAANGAGDYQLSTGGNVDNALYVWTGDVSYTDYDNDNTAYQAVRAGSGPYTGGQTTLTLAEYEMVPITIMWVNGGGIGAAFMTVVDPNGIEYYDTTSGFFLPSDDYRVCFQSNPFSP